jgi:tRNA G10  N-methylase Trm11
LTYKEPRTIWHYFIINQQYPCLSRTELESLLKKYRCGRIVGEFTGLLVIEDCSDRKVILIQKKSSTLKESGKIFAITESDPKALNKKLSFLKNYCGHKLYLKVERIQELGKHFRQNDVIKVIMSYFKKYCRKHCGKKEKKTLKVILTDGALFIVEPLSNTKKGEIIRQNPHNLPFYKPGALNPWYARLLINIASDKAKIYYDPFCGTGTIPLAASEIWKTESICSDIRRDMCAGALKNSVELNRDSFINVVRADA